MSAADSTDRPAAGLADDDGRAMAMDEDSSETAVKSCGGLRKETLLRNTPRNAPRRP